MFFVQKLRRGQYFGQKLKKRGVSLGFGHNSCELNRTLPAANLRGLLVLGISALGLSGGELRKMMNKGSKTLGQG